MNIWRFQLYTFAGSFLWCYALAYVGFQLGASWQSSPMLRSVFHSADPILAGAIAVKLMVVLVLRLGARWRKAEPSDRQPG